MVHNSAHTHAAAFLVAVANHWRPYPLLRVGAASACTIAAYGVWSGVVALLVAALLNEHIGRGKGWYLPPRER